MSESWLMDDVLQAVKGQLGAFGDLGTDTAIRDCLMLSYTDLGRRDPKLQTMFLDTAWMMLGRDREEAEWIFEGTCSTTGGSPRIDLQTLIDLSLVDCDAHGCLSMHDALTDMARHIISQPGTIPKYQIVCDKDIQVSVEMSQNKLNRMDGSHTLAMVTMWACQKAWCVSRSIQRLLACVCNLQRSQLL